jgi:hypothetical protein
VQNRTAFPIRQLSPAELRLIRRRCLLILRLSQTCCARVEQGIKHEVIVGTRPKPL